MSSVVHDSILIYITQHRIAYLFMHVGHGSEPTTEDEPDPITIPVLLSVFTNLETFEVRY
jgi:hypothetical protein